MYVEHHLVSIFSFGLRRVGFTGTALWITVAHGASSLFDALEKLLVLLQPVFPLPHVENSGLSSPKVVYSIFANIAIETTVITN